MKHIVEAGTDAASLLLFDPLTLPEGFDAQSEEAIDVLDRLDTQERLAWINTEGDGGYLLHAFVDEPPPKELRPYMKAPRTVGHFSVASGEVYFSGAEYGFHAGDTALDDLWHMGAKFPMPNGPYHVELYLMEYPDGLVQQRFRDQATPIEYAVHSVFGYVAATAVLAMIAMVIGLALVPFKLWLVYVLPPAIVFTLVPVVISVLPAYRSANSAWRDVEREYPSFVAMFTRKR